MTCIILHYIPKTQADVWYLLGCDWKIMFSG